MSVGQSAGDCSPDQCSEEESVFPAADGLLDSEAADEKRSSTHQTVAGQTKSSLVSINLNHFKLFDYTRFFI